MFKLKQALTAWNIFFLVSAWAVVESHSVPIEANSTALLKGRDAVLFLFEDCNARIRTRVTDFLALHLTL